MMTLSARLSVGSKADPGPVGSGFDGLYLPVCVYIQTMNRLKRCFKIVDGFITVGQCKKRQP